MTCCLPSDALAETFLYLHEMEAISHTCDRALEDVERRNWGEKKLYRHFINHIHRLQIYRQKISHLTTDDRTE
jgi:hypothetical protein